MDWSCYTQHFGKEDLLVQHMCRRKCNNEVHIRVIQQETVDYINLADDRLCAVLKDEFPKNCSEFVKYVNGH
jgi:hypothetical protein